VRVRAAVTRAVGEMALVDVAEPGEPGPGEVIVRSEAVGICGSDYHFLLGELSAAAGGGASPFPKIQGHEVAGTIEALGPGCRPDLGLAARVALYPLHACGHCYPCRVGRPNTCDNFTLIGIHLDGGLQQRLRIPQEQVFPIATEDSAVAALAEPVSIAVRAVHRARIEAGEHVVVLGAGPIGQCVCLLARERGAEVLVVDLQERRLPLSREMGATGLVWTDAGAVVSAARDWAGAGGPPVVIDATGAAPAVRAMVEMVASAGRAVQVGMSNEEVPIRIGSLTEKELDLLGVSCCGGGEFAEAVAAVERNAAMLARLISHEFPLERAPEAIDFAIEHPAEVMKVVIRVD
jgi:threonine dehydrogenase-like Zn-dependent dehydrogenase